MSKYDQDPAAAEADLKRANDASFNADCALHEAEEVAMQIEQETPQTREEEADVTRRMELAEREIERLRAEAVDAEQRVLDTASFWGLAD